MSGKIHEAAGLQGKIPQRLLRMARENGSPMVAATQEARAVNPHISTTVERGRFNVVEVRFTKENGRPRTKVLHLAGPFSEEEALAFLRGVGSSAGLPDRKVNMQ